MLSHRNAQISSCLASDEQPIEQSVQQVAPYYYYYYYDDDDDDDERQRTERGKWEMCH